MWGVPVDHEMFREISSSQWLWYYHNFIKDRDEKFEENRDMVEYHASFIEPEAVRKIKEAREQAVEVPDEQFISGIEQMFGRSLPSVKNQQEKEMHKVDIGKVLDNYNNIKKSDVPKEISYKDWLNMDLEK
ncbi:MAG: hypothetical protein WC523_00565 [Patescibacteria group bacterium]